MEGMALIDLLTFLATAAGSGWLASRLFNALRDLIPRPTAVEWVDAPRLAQFGWSLLYAPAYVRVTVFVLAAVIAALASFWLDLLAGRDALAALDAAAAIIASQLIHAWGKSGVPAFDDQ